MKKELAIEGMMCEHCARHVSKALEGLPGAAEVSVDLAGKKALVSVPDTVTDEAIKAAIADAGYEVAGIKTS